jgi:GNAT superfamily N-acetyltransferase
VSGVLLRPARTTDAGRVGEILSGFVDDTPWLPRLHSRAEDLSFAGEMIDRGWVTVAEGPDGVTGFVARDGAEIHALYVDAAVRGTGCGTALLRRMKAQVAALTLWTAEANARARAFYRAHAFAEVERTSGAQNDAGLPDIRLEWQRGV